MAGKIIKVSEEAFRHFEWQRRQIERLKHELELASLSIEARDEIIATLRDALGAYQSRDQLVTALNKADLRPLTAKGQ